MDKTNDSCRGNIIDRLLHDIGLLLQYVKILERGRINYLLYGENDVLYEYKQLEAIEQQLQLIKFKED